MKSIEEVRKICGHYHNNPKYNRLLSPHRCLHIDNLSCCVDKFKECPLYKLVQRNNIKECK